MSDSEKQDALRGENLSDWAESLDSIPTNAIVIRGIGGHLGRALLEAALGSPDAVDEALGRPSAGGGAGRE